MEEEMKALGLIQFVAETLVAGIFKLLLKATKTRSWVVNKIELWSDANRFPGIRYGVSATLQDAFAKVSGGKICGYCQWNIKPGERHGYCEVVLKVQGMGEDELLRTWKALKQYDPKELYDRETGVTMETWAETIYSEVSRRGLDWRAYEDEAPAPADCLAAY